MEIEQEKKEKDKQPKKIIYSIKVWDFELW